MDINIINEIRALIGTVPPGWEPIEYAVAGIVLIFLLHSAYSIVAMVFRWIGGGM